MRKETIAKVREMATQLGCEAIHFQGDNTNFFSEGESMKGNAVIFNDTDEVAWALRVNDNFPSVGGRYRISAFDYDTLQYAVMEVDNDMIDKFIDIIAPSASNLDKDKVKKRFTKSKYDKGFVYTREKE